jgi:pyruvate dehydrogenase E2 component (dihydrolipoamide acetyltransferase)
MPRLSDSMVEGTIVRWLKAHGDEVRRGDEIVEIETDKATMAYEAEADGSLSILEDEGATVEVGAAIAEIASDVSGSSTPPPAARAETSASSSRTSGGGAPGSVATVSESTQATAPANAAAPANGPRGISAAPVARRAAERLGVDLSTLSGTGPFGRITKADVVAAATAAAAPTPAASAPAVQSDAALATTSVPSEDALASTIGLTRTQEVVARRMMESRATVPDFAVEVDVEMTAAVALRAELKRVADPSPSINDLIVKAVAIALRRHPRANGSYRDGAFELHTQVNVGVAVAATDALVVPVVRDADTKSVGALAAEARALAERVRAGSITPPELSGGTFTVSNLGMYGIDRFEGIINPPQAAILCVGAVKERPIARDGNVVIAPQMTLTLASDHRILYGADAAAFLAEIRGLLEQPYALML